MRIKRAIIIPAILAFGATGSVLAASAMPAVVAAAPSAHVLLTASAKPDTYFQG
jgi:hypothetical protein